ncbi:MAG: zinc ribbon domain-containing protein [Planctomycetes bacterium]|nr:zinc ribbon domain-containing protein [Planctomycetota bacterium]
MGEAMPNYEYHAKEVEKACDHCRDRFEVRQSMSDEPLTACPKCGNAVERVISLCTVSTAQSVKSMLSDKNLKSKGFTKLVNEGGGRFRKTT